MYLKSLIILLVFCYLSVEALKCLPCEKRKCEEEEKEICDEYTLDICKCCLNRCAKKEGEECGDAWTLKGICGQGLICDMGNVFDDYQSMKSGTCKKPTSPPYKES